MAETTVQTQETAQTDGVNTHTHTHSVGSLYKQVHSVLGATQPKLLQNSVISFGKYVAVIWEARSCAPGGLPCSQDKGSGHTVG